jgi:hypothetical protein
MRNRCGRAEKQTFSNISQLSYSVGSAKGPETDGPVELIKEEASKIRHTLSTSHTGATEPMRQVAIDGTAREKARLVRELSTVATAGSRTRQQARRLRTRINQT